MQAPRETSGSGGQHRPERSHGDGPRNGSLLDAAEKPALVGPAPGTGSDGLRPHGPADRVRRWLHRRLMALRLGGEPATAEGLAAGTGLLTGPSARARAGIPQPCPRCAGTGEVVMVDLISFEVIWRCASCQYEWAYADLPSSPLDS